jgi:UDP-N-acetylglucosamine 2-epimerase (non-hydrolysing)
MPAPRTFVSVVGARPNFMKLAPLARALARTSNVQHVVVHTGQHHDPSMSQVFFQDLGLSPPHHSLHVGSGSHAQQTATVMYRLEPLLRSIHPELLVVYGDVNSTVAAALTASKLGIRVAHVEAGLRSGDRTMPEEINRVLTDHCADLLFAPSDDAVENLGREGITDGRVHMVGNIMIDSLVAALPKARETDMRERLGLTRKYAVVTLHRPSNVDDPARLDMLVNELSSVSRHITVVFPVHPRTRARLRASKQDISSDADIRFVDPLGYHSMLSLVSSARLVITDSGGVQEETSWLGVPCLTVRASTERPVTVTLGTNKLVAMQPKALSEAVLASLERPMPERPKIPMWDGKTGDRIAAVLTGQPAG